jgi:hypothetical protein
LVDLPCISGRKSPDTTTIHINHWLRTLGDYKDYPTNRLMKSVLSSSSDKERKRFALAAGKEKNFLCKVIEFRET